jgi:hypothetical protein
VLRSVIASLAVLTAAAALLVVPAAGEAVTPAQLQAHGWSCFVPPPFPDTVVCGNPAHGLPPVPPDPDGRASYSFLFFDRATGELRGTIHMIRADLYHGQPCAETGGDYVFNPLNGYYRCGM